MTQATLMLIVDLDRMEVNNNDSEKNMKRVKFKQMLSELKYLTYNQKQKLTEKTKIVKPENKFNYAIIAAFSKNVFMLKCKYVYNSMLFFIFCVLNNIKML